MWRFATGQAVGSSHEKLKTPSQDRLACAVISGEETLVAVVCDGAGSARWAHIGAEIVVSTVHTVAQLGVKAGRRDYPEILRESALLARQRLLEESASRKAPLRDFACTLLAAIVPPVGGAALQLGDGAIVLNDATESWRCVFWPQKGEYANATYFLTDDTAVSTLQLATLPNETLDIALFSDGLEPLALHFATRTAYQPFFKTAFASVHAASATGELSELSQSLSAFLQTPTVRSRTDDDTSLVLATRRQSTPQP